MVVKRSKNKVKRTKRVKKVRSQRVKRTKRTKRVQRTKRTRRSFLKNKRRKTQKRKRVLRGGMEAAAEPVGFPPGVLYDGTHNETEERICRKVTEIISRLLQSGAASEISKQDMSRILMGAFSNSLKIEIDAAKFLKDKEKLGKLPYISEELYKEFMDMYYPGDKSNAEGGVEKEMSEGHKYAFESVYHSGNFDRESKYVIEGNVDEHGYEDAVPDIPFEEVVQDLLNYCGSKLSLDILVFLLNYGGSKFSLDTLLSLGDILFSDCYPKDLREVMGTFLESIQNNPNSTEFIFITMKKFERRDSDIQEEISKFKGVAKLKAQGKDKKDNWCEKNITFLKDKLFYGELMKIFEIYFEKKYFYKKAFADLEEVPIGASGQREEAARAAGASFGFFGVGPGGQDQVADMIEYAIKNNLYTETFQEIMDKYFTEELPRRAAAGITESVTQSVGVPGAEKKGSAQEASFPVGSGPGTTPPD